MTHQNQTVAPVLFNKDSERLVTRKRVITKRAVMWLGQTCNQRCWFCYFIDAISNPHSPEHAFMTLEKAKAICHVLRTFYDNTSIDIQGGEPTIFPGILDLVHYCREIGLYPTLITNGIALAKPGVLEKYKEAGIRDFLVSLHGLREIHDEVVCKKGAYEKIAAAIDGMREVGIPFRYNCTMSKPVIPILPEIAQHAIDHGARVVNFIHFNPFRDQTGRVTPQGVEQYSVIKPRLTEAIDLLESHGIEANVRYLPLCMVEERHRKNVYNWQQLSYDTHEWDLESWLWTMMGPQMTREGHISPPFRLGPWARAFACGDYRKSRQRYEQNSLVEKGKYYLQRRIARLTQAVLGKKTLLRREAKIRVKTDLQYVHGAPCQQCAARDICDGFHKDYVTLFGFEEARPIQAPTPITDPLHYIQHQEKIVEPEDKHWAL